MLSEALLCLALNIYYEARGEPLQGQIAVAHVTLNRARHPGEVCEVINQPGQFSWVNSKNSKPRGEAWDKAKEIATEVIEGDVDDPTMGATHFHKTSVNPPWSKTLRRTTSVGRHIFYKAHKRR